MRATRAFEWFLGRNALQKPLYDFATGGCSDGLGSEALNQNEGAESTLAFHRAALLLDAAGVRATVGEPALQPAVGMSEPELFSRHPGNPILTAGDWPYPVNAVFNPAAAALDGETVLLARVEDRSGISHLTVARSANGVDGWSIDPEPLLAPDDDVASEQWGFEDARVVWVDELDRWVITCTAYGPAGPAVFLATTEDFTLGRALRDRQAPGGQERRAPARTGSTAAGCSSTVRRPQFGGSHGEILLSRSDDLVSWSAPEQVLQPRAGAWWDSLRIGIGPPPLQTEHGWLLVYHGVKETVAGDIYRVGLALLDLDEPTRVLRRLPDWVLAPLAPYERIGDVPNVVFPCGLLHDAASDEIRLYYGAADTSICLATARLADLLDAVLAAPVDRLSSESSPGGVPALAVRPSLRRVHLFGGSAMWALGAKYSERWWTRRTHARCSSSAGVAACSPACPCSEAASRRMRRRRAPAVSLRPSRPRSSRRSKARHSRLPPRP